MWNSSRYFVTRYGNEARLTIREVKDTDTGVYECNAGSVITKATVTVKGIPLLLKKSIFNYADTARK